jgi:peptidoglycan hydrolase-like protein with peptidoglycan-binding domain
MRRLILATVSVLALGIAGVALDYAADAGNEKDAGSAPPAVETPRISRSEANLWKDDIRWAQVELRFMGLYKGSLDGIAGPETKQAIEQFQRNNGLERTATLDPKTLDALLGNSGIGYGSSMPPDAERARSNTSRSDSSNSGNQSITK